MISTSLPNVLSLFPPGSNNLLVSKGIISLSSSWPSQTFFACASLAEISTQQDKNNNRAQSQQQSQSSSNSNINSSDSDGSGVARIPQISLWNSRTKVLIGKTDIGIGFEPNDCQLAWRTNGTHIAALWTSVSKDKITSRRLQIFQFELSSTSMFDLPHSDWWEDFGLLSIESLAKFASLKQIQLSPENDKWASENILSLSTSRNWLVCGTSKGTIARLSWQGELVDEFSLSMEGLFVEEDIGRPLQEQNTSKLDNEKLIICMAAKVRGRLYGYVTGSGSCYLAILPNSERPGTLNSDGLFSPLGIARLHGSQSKVISISEGRPYVAVGLMDGSVDIHGVSVFTTEHGTVAIEHTRLRTLHCQAPSSCYVSSIVWCPDNPSDCLCVGYVEKDASFDSKNILSTYHNLDSARHYSVWSSGGICLSSAVGGGKAVAWGPQGYTLFYSSSSNNPQSTIFAQEFAKCCGSSLSPLRTSAWLRTFMQTTDSIHVLRGHDWDPDVLSWMRFEIPRVYLNRNWPIISVAVNPIGNAFVIAGIRGCAIYSLRLKRWRIFGSIQQEQSIIGANVFWINNKVFGIVHADIASRSYILLCYPSDHLDNSSLLCQVKLPGRPVAADIDSTESTLVMQIHGISRPYVYRIKYQDVSVNTRQLLEINLIPNSSDGSATHGTNASSSAGVDGSDMYNSNDSQETPRSLGTISLIALPFGGSRRAGEPIKFPRCVTLDAIGRVHLVDTESGTRTKVTGISEKSTYQIWSYTWRHLQQDWYVITNPNRSSNLSQQVGQNQTASASSARGSGRISPRSFEHTAKIESRSSSMQSLNEFEDGSPRVSSKRIMSQNYHHDWPTGVRHALWVVDREYGVRLWLPALDEMAETLDNHGVVALDEEVYPLGVHPRLGVLMAISSVPGAAIQSQVCGPFASNALRCSEIRTHIRPCLQGLLMWLVRARRTDIAKDIVSLAASYHFPLFPEALESLLHEALEEEFTYDKEQRALRTPGQGGAVTAPSSSSAVTSSPRVNDTKKNAIQASALTWNSEGADERFFYQHSRPLSPSSGMGSWLLSPRASNVSNSSHNSYSMPSENSLVSQIVSLLKHCPFPIFASVVMNCARTVEDSRWRFIFPLAGRPEDLFELCCGEAAMETARNNLSQSKQPKDPIERSREENHVRVLLHIAAGYLPLIQDKNKEALTLRVKNLCSLCEDINDTELSVEVMQYANRRQQATEE